MGGVTRGRYQYVDANGLVQTVNYISDDINGFRVSGTNLPVAPAALPAAPAAPLPAPVKETPEVAKARAEHLAAHEEAKTATESVEKTKREAAEDESEPEPEPEPQDKKKREAEPIDGDYEIPAAPVIVSAPVPLPVTTSHLQHTVSPVVGPLQPALLPSRHPFHTSLPFPAQPINYAPDFLPFAPEPLPFGPEQIAVVPEQLRFAPEPQFLAPASIPDFIPAAVPGPIAAPIAAPIPTPVAAPIAAPLAAPVAAPITAPSSQFHAQDEFGQFSFGYENINSAKQETKDAFGVTRGSYQYVDANGLVQSVNYIADDVNGFRVAGTNIPTAPAALPAALPIGPAPVAETPEVAAARAA